MKLTIIFPCYNNGKLLINNLHKLSNYFNKDVKIVVVNDGSTDNTLEILKEIKNINVLSYEKNKGKGGAVQYGIQHIDPCDIVIMIDCDLSTDVRAIDDSIKELKENDIVIASRALKESRMPVKRKLKRRIVSKCCNIIVNSLFHFCYKDTQCGFKTFKYDIAKKLADKQIIMSWAFDVEYLYIAKLNNYKVKEIPVVWTESDSSTIKAAAASFGFIKSLFKIKRNKKNY